MDCPDIQPGVGAAQDMLADWKDTYPDYAPRRLAEARNGVPLH